jgi:5-formyltetrahydrofolate cyclo-ligase
VQYNSKNDLREHFLKILKAQDFSIESSNIQSNLMNFLEAHKLSEVVGIYYPLPEEPTLDLNLFNKAYKIALPKIYNQHIKYHLFDPAKLTFNKYNIAEPIEQLNQVLPEIIIIHELAFDIKGYRLGRGKGYFDRFLSNSKQEKYPICAIGVCYEIQIIDNFPLELHDQQLHYIITEQRIIKIK